MTRDERLDRAMRINHVVEHFCDGDMGEFAQRINVSPKLAEKLCSGCGYGIAGIEEAIVGAFGVNADWLRNGVGEMREKKSELASVLLFDNAEIDMLNSFSRLTPANKLIVTNLVAFLREEQAEE